MITTGRAELLVVGGMVAARRSARAAQLRRRVSRIVEIGLRREATTPATDHASNNDVIKSAAQRLDVSVEELRGGFLRLGYGGRTVLSRNGAFPFESLTASLAANDKRLTSVILAEHGLPVPRFEAFSIREYLDARRFFEALPKPVVVKPNLDTFGGQGVVLNVRTPRQFRRGFVTALVYSSEALVEEQVPGESYRATVLDQDVVSVVRRLPASVIGDGVSSVHQLIEARNAAFQRGEPWIRQVRPIAVDREIRGVLARHGLTLASVPADGERVVLRDVSNAVAGGEVAEVTDRVHPDYLALAVAAARTMQVKLCGVDLLATRIERPMQAGNVWVNEINTTPSLDVVHEPRGGEIQDKIGEAILRYVFELPPGAPSPASL